MEKQSPKHIIDFTCPGLELIFRDNCYLRTFHMKDENLTREELTVKALEAAAILTKLFWSAYWIVEVAPVLEFDVIDQANRQSLIFHKDLLSAFETVAQQTQRYLVECGFKSNPMCLYLLQQVGPGASRIALPEGVNGSGTWRCVDCDGNLRSGREAGVSRVEELSAAWVEMEEAWPTNEIRVQMDWLGEIDIHLKLGNLLFQPSLDPRPPEYLIRSKPLQEWQQVNGMLLASIIRDLKELGFQAGEV